MLLHGLSTVPDNQVSILGSHEYSVWSRRFKRPVGLRERNWQNLLFSQTRQDCLWELSEMSSSCGCMRKVRTRSAALKAYTR